MRARAEGLSDVGMQRSHNEDELRKREDLQLFVVADGMGGHSHGEIASRIAGQAIEEFVAQTADHDNTWPFVYDARLQRHSNRLKAAIRIAHDKVLRAIRQDASLHGMGTTVVSLLLHEQTAAIAHVGDSRAYVWRGGRLELLTHDHTWVAEQVAAGYLTDDQARSHPLKNVVTRALGGDAEVAVDVREFEVQPGDLFLLCSDGLTTMLGDAEIASYLTRCENLFLTCQALVREANARGGQDNITVLLARVEAAEDEG